MCILSVRPCIGECKDRNDRIKLIDMIDMIEKKKPTMDAMRKRALAAACQYLEALRSEEYLKKDYAGRMAYAKGMICRAAQVENGSFNRIGRERLRGLTAMFNKLKKDMDGVMAESLRALVSGDRKIDRYDRNNR